MGITETGVIFTILGMSCGHCVGAVTDELSRLDGVTTVEVDLETGTVTLQADRPLEADAIAAAVDAAGYRVAQ
jgi:copper chaperone CopZ